MTSFEEAGNRSRGERLRAEFNMTVKKKNTLLFINEFRVNGPRSI